MSDISPSGRGDEQSFRAEMEVTDGWSGYYKTWLREWTSPRPDVLTIRDTYDLAAGDGVEFYWNTQCDVTISGNAITLTGERGTITINTPQDCDVREDRLPLHNAAGLVTPKRDFQRRIAVRRYGAAGTIEIEAHLAVRK